ncbi:hypothetical protein [Streptomyces sp. NBC_00076]|uniref:hypothetical protein n=1 Tax=Streptomyces sp. NBC_00076 TaxID=2975642 RepID=UPI00324C802B
MSTDPDAQVRVFTAPDARPDHGAGLPSGRLAAAAFNPPRWVPENPPPAALTDAAAGVLTRAGGVGDPVPVSRR